MSGDDNFERQNGGRIGIGPDEAKGQVRTLTGVLIAITPAEKPGDSYYQFSLEGGKEVEVFDNKALKDNLDTGKIGQLIRLDYIRTGTTKAGKSFKEISVSVAKNPTDDQRARFPALGPAVAAGDASEDADLPM